LYGELLLKNAAIYGGEKVGLKSHKEIAQENIKFRKKLIFGLIGKKIFSKKLRNFGKIQGISLSSPII
jgi:hypothetical protein